MKLIAYALFVVTVLLFSGFARAMSPLPAAQPPVYQTPIAVDSVALDSLQNQLILSGHLPTPCQAAPAAILTPEENDPYTLSLRLSSPYYTGACISRIQDFSMAIDLVTLVQASQVHIDRKAVYRIKTQGYEFEMQIVGAALTH